MKKLNQDKKWTPTKDITSAKTFVNYFEESQDQKKKLFLALNLIFIASLGSETYSESC